jgi:hypothetical protein
MNMIQEAKPFVRCKGKLRGPETNSIVDCDREANTSGAALDLCVRCYKRYSKWKKGLGPNPLDVKTLASPGESDDVTFRVLNSKREIVQAEAARRTRTESREVPEAEIYREALDLWLAVQSGKLVVVGSHGEPVSFWAAIRAIAP